MLFYEPLFLFLFGPAVYLLYLFFGEVRARRAVILFAASVVFYAWSEPVFIFLVFASVGLDLYVGQKIAAHSAVERRHAQDAAGWRSASSPISRSSSITNIRVFSRSISTRC